MGKNNNTIQFDGKRYDARSGRPIPAAGQAAGNSIDGMVGGAGRRHGDVPAAAKQPSRPATVPAGTMQDVIRSGGGRAGRTAEPSHTLMRRGVRRPAAGAHSSAPKRQQLARQSFDIMPKGPVRPDNQRLQRAGKAVRSQAIHHFDDSQFRPSAAAVQLTAQPAATGGAAAEPAPAPPPILGRPEAEKPRRAKQPAAAARPQLASERHKPKRSRTKRLAIAGTGVVSLALIAFVGLQNLTNIKLQLASAKAGFSAAAPSYQPAGFHVDGLQYGPGLVAIKYQGGSNASNYTLTEKSSQWSNQDLLNKFVLKTTDSYAVASGSGRQVYLYGNGSATWVVSGVWYQVNSGGALSNEQLAKLAMSL